MELVDQDIRQALKNWPTIFKRYAEPDTGKAILQIFNSFLPFIGIWVLMYYSLSWSYWITLPLAFLNAFFTVRIFIIQHDCGHRSFLKSQTANKIIGWICSVFTFIPFRYWARVHDFHHGHSGQLEFRDIGDIQTMTVKEYETASPGKRLGYRIFRMPLVTFVIGPVIYLVWNNRFPLVRFKGWEKTYIAQQFNNLLIAVAYIGTAWLVGWKAFLLVQAPILVFFSIIAVWFFFVQHQHEETYKQWRDQWEYLLAAVKGSTYYKLPRAFQWLTGNIGFHHIHHLNSKIPNYHLEQAHKENRFIEKYITTLRFRQSLKCMFNKLWCEDEQRMISFREFRRRQQRTAAA